jgi:hypothetical protein
MTALKLIQKQGIRSKYPHLDPQTQHRVAQLFSFLLSSSIPSRSSFTVATARQRRRKGCARVDRGSSWSQEWKRKGVWRSGQGMRKGNWLLIAQVTVIKDGHFGFLLFFKIKKPNFLNLQHIQLISKTRMWVAKSNRLGELNAATVTDHPSEISSKKSFFGLFSKCPINISWKKILGCYRNTEASALDDAAVDIRWPLSPPRMRSASQLQRRLSEERESTILRARAASGGEWVRLAGTFEERDRASDLWTRERASFVVGAVVTFWAEIASGVRRRRETHNNNVRLRCEKKGDHGWQSKETSPRQRAYPIGSPSKKTRPNKHVSPVQKLWVTDFISYYQYDTDQ